MRILLVTDNFAAADLAYRLQRSGNDVRVYVKEKEYVGIYTGMLRKVSSWKKCLPWVGMDGLIIFDCTGYGKVQDDLRKKGYSVVGGCEAGDRCEDDRTYGQEVFWMCGMKMIPSKDFASLDDAIHFVKKHPKPWVIKQNGHVSKTFNYVGSRADGSDVVSVLESYRKNVSRKDTKSIQLQERIFGVEVGVGRYFNGTNWVGPIEMNIEHKDLNNGDLGPKTDEMGTVMWFDSDELNPLYVATLAKMKDYLTSIHFKGDVDINCIVNESGVYPLEITARFGFPALQLQQVLSPNVDWAKFLKAVADGEQYDFEYKKGEYGVIVLVAVPPFPYASAIKNRKPINLDFFLDETMTEEERRHVHFEEVAKRRNGQLYVTGCSGFALHVSGTGKGVAAARKQVYENLKKVILPKMFYRTDVGHRFEQKDKKKLKDWGYIK